jgi:hypothetical protein
MAERWKRQRFTAEFKAGAVKRLLEGGKGLSKVAGALPRRVLQPEVRPAPAPADAGSYLASRIRPAVYVGV